MNESSTGSNRLDAVAAAGRFALPAPVETVEPFGKGLINDTFLATAGGSKYILQRVNGSVFPQPDRIMSNLALLQAHLASRTRSGFRLPHLIRARDGRPCARGEDGEVWRLMEFLADSETLQRIEKRAQAREVGRILGRFHALVGDLDPARLAVTLPGFHVTPLCYEHLMQILDRGSGKHPNGILQAIAFATARRASTAVLEDARLQGYIPTRVIHGDPKLDNILFDCSTGRAIGLIDLDTVQPGLVHYDLGDCLRSCCNRGGESSGGNEDTRFDLDLCRSILRTYASETRGLLGGEEISLLFDAIRLIPFELGLRFLTDHLEGNRYFRVTEPGQNLRKAHVQFALVEDIERKEQEIRSIVARCFASDGS